MGVPGGDNDVVQIQQGSTPGEPFVVTVSCPDKTGLACDVFRIILDFGLSIAGADVTKVLSELELTIQKVKVTTTPDDTVLDLFFITDNMLKWDVIQHHHVNERSTDSFWMRTVNFN